MHSVCIYIYNIHIWGNPCDTWIILKITHFVWSVRLPLIYVCMCIYIYIHVGKCQNPGSHCAAIIIIYLFFLLVTMDCGSWKYRQSHRQHGRKWTVAVKKGRAQYIYASCTQNGPMKTRKLWKLWKIFTSTYNYRHPYEYFYIYIWLQDGWKGGWKKIKTGYMSI